MNFKKLSYIVFILFSSSMIHAKNRKHAHPLKEIKNTASIVYQPCQPSLQLNFEPFPIEYKPKLQPHNPTFLENFILHIPHGKVYGQDGIVLEKDRIINDLGWQNDSNKQICLKKLNVQNEPRSKIAGFPNPTKIKGKVAVIAQRHSNYYSHWMIEIIGRLLLLESQNIEYDYLFVPACKPYMIESLELCGINRDKIIEPCGQYTYIEADELIVPSMVNQINPSPSLACYQSPEIIKLLQNKFLPKVESLLATNPSFLSKKIFISRNDAAIRKLTNEDDLFEQLEPYGFQRYYLSQLSVLEQIVLFNYADVIVSLHSSALINLIFSQPGTHVVEIFQARSDASFWYASQILDLHHICIKTCELDNREINQGSFDTTISQPAIDQVIDTIQSFNDRGLPL